MVCFFGDDRIQWLILFPSSKSILCFNPIRRFQLCQCTIIIMSCPMVLQTAVVVIWRMKRTTAILLEGAIRSRIHPFLSENLRLFSTWHPSLMVRAVPHTLDRTQQRLCWNERGNIADALDLLGQAGNCQLQIGQVKLIGAQKVHDSQDLRAWVHQYRRLVTSACPRQHRRRVEEEGYWEWRCSVSVGEIG